jgi:hypothetical protein
MRQPGCTGWASRPDAIVDIRAGGAGLGEVLFKGEMALRIGSRRLPNL